MADTIRYKPKGFLNLPAELRNQIYALVLTLEDHSITPRWEGPDSLPRHRGINAMTQVPRALRAETLSSYYASTTFRLVAYNARIDHKTTLWLRSLSNIAVASLRRLSIEYTHPQRVDCCIIFEIDLGNKERPIAGLEVVCYCERCKDIKGGINGFYKAYTLHDSLGRRSFLVAKPEGLQVTIAILQIFVDELHGVLSTGTVYTAHRIERDP